MYRYDLDPTRLADRWRRCSVISSRLLDIGRVADSGEERRTMTAAIDESVPVPILSAVRYGRFSSRGGVDFGNRVSSAIYKQSGGHDEYKQGSS